MPDPEMQDIMRTLAESAERVLQARSTPDGGTWVVIAVVPLNAVGLVASPMLAGRISFTMRRFATAEEAMANSVAMPAAKVYGGYTLNIATGETRAIAPFQNKQPL